MPSKRLHADRHTPAAIRDGSSLLSTFETAVELHRLVDAIKQTADSGRKVPFA